MFETNEETLDRSPNIKSLIKNFERTLSPVISYKPRSTVSVLRNIKSDESKDGQTQNENGREMQVQESLSIADTVEDAGLGQDEDVSLETLKSSRPSDQTTLSPVSDIVQVKKALLIKQREEVIKGLREHFMHFNDKVNKQSHLTVAIPLDSPLTNVDSDYVEHDIDPAFTLSFESVHKVTTPERTRYGNIEDNISSLIRYCQIAVTQLTPKMSRKNHNSSEYDKISDHVSQTTLPKNRSHHFRCFIGLLKKMCTIGLSLLRVAYTVMFKAILIVKSTFSFLLQGLKEVMAVTILSVKITFRQRVHLGVDAWGAWISLWFSMIASIYPTVPRANTAIICFLMFNYSIDHEKEAERNFHVFFIVLTLISFIVNLSWLWFPYHPSPLNHQTDFLPYNISDEKSTTRVCCWYFSLLSAVMNIITAFFAIKSKSKILDELWNKIRLFIPIIPSHSRLESFNESLPSRVIAIAWLHLLGSMIFFCVGLIAQFQLGYSFEYSTPYPFLTLKTITFVKAATSLAVVLSTLHNTDFWDFFAEFGCVNPCHKRYNRRRKRLLLKRGFQGPAVLITSNFVRFIGFLKIIDEVVGIFMWISLSKAFAVDGLQSIKQIRLMIGFSYLSLTVCDILGLLLVAAVYYFYSGHNDGTNKTAILEEIKNKMDEEKLSKYPVEEVLEIRSPTDFSLMWKYLPSGMIVKSLVRRKPPTLHQCVEFMEIRDFFVIASGVVDHSTKIFAFACKDDVPGLVAVEVDSSGSRIQLKCRVHGLLDYFLHLLAPEELFGENFYRE